ncbi:MAG: MBL fold metallo-hydrolase [Bacteroidota bacterium]
MSYHITGYSTALFSTWFFIDELGLLFDAGDGLSAGLLQKSRKIKQVFISHADRDHLCGLLQFHQLNARPGFPIIHYPKDSGSFPALRAFLERFDPHVGGSQWLPIEQQQEVFIRKDLKIKAIRNNHVQVAPELNKSLSFQLIHTKQKIKPAFEKLAGKEIAKIAKEKGKDFITYEVTKPLLGYSGDTPVEADDRWDQTPILIHEATFLEPSAQLNNHKNKHSTLDEVLKMVASIKVDQLILSHFSSRYDPTEIDAAIRKYCKQYKVKIPVYRVLPGVVHRDILNEAPINDG